MTTFPAVRVETDRLVVREFGPGDAAGVTLVIAAGEWEALPPGAPSAPSGVWRWLREEVHWFRKGGLGVHLAVQDRASGAHIGAMSLFNPDWATGRVEIGYGARPHVRGRGYVTEALNGLTDWVLAGGGMRRIELKTEPDNKASIRVAEKCGYAFEAAVLDPASGKEMLLFSRFRLTESAVR
jgi:RimJ/RimL family protein N-acetyltransferase